MNTLTLRLSNGFGCPMGLEVNRWTLVFNDLCRQAMTSGEMILRSSGKQHRDFIALHDVAAAVDHFLFVNSEKWGDGLFNLGGDCSLSILEVAKTIATVYEKKYGKPVSILAKDNTRAEDLFEDDPHLLREEVLESMSKEALKRLGKLTGSIIEEHVMLLSGLRKQILTATDTSEIKRMSSKLMLW